MERLSTFVGIISGLCGIIGLIITIINSKKIGKFGIIMIVVILVAVMGTGVLFSTSTTITPHPPTNPFASQPTPTAASTLTPTEPIPTPILTEPASTPTEPPLAGPETLPENITLKCECSDLVLVKITQVQIQPDQNRMLWSLTLKNTSQSTVDQAFFQPFSLQKGDQVHDPTPGEQPYQPTGPGVSDNLPTLRPGGMQQIVTTFSFVPHTGVPYTLVSTFVDGITSGGVHFNPVLIQF